MALQVQKLGEICLLTSVVGESMREPLKKNVPFPCRKNSKDLDFS